MQRLLSVIVVVYTGKWVCGRCLGKMDGRKEGREEKRVRSVFIYARQALSDLLVAWKRKEKPKAREMNHSLGNHGCGDQNSSNQLKAIPFSF